MESKLRTSASMLHPRARPIPEMAVEDVSDDDDEQQHHADESPVASSGTEPCATHEDFSGGLIWHAAIVKSNFCDKKIVDSEGKIKPRRPLPHMFASEFFPYVVRDSEGRWIFTGVLNGWGMLTNLEVPTWILGLCFCVLWIVSLCQLLACSVRVNCID